MPHPQTTPTLIIGLGGTGLDILLRIRRKVYETYGNLDRLPIGFLAIDTQPEMTVAAAPLAAPPLQGYEKLWARVTFEEVHQVMRFPENYPGVHQWLPKELLTKPELLISEEGAGQIRACGRLAFYLNQDAIATQCKALAQKVQHHAAQNSAHQNSAKQNFSNSSPKTTLQKATAPRLNVWVLASLSGGTGSGMLIDLGYGLRHWLGDRYHLETATIMLSPDAFSGTQVGLRMRENSYAALMELNYFTDDTTRYELKFNGKPTDNFSDYRSPYDFPYLVGSSGQSLALDLETIHEMVSQHIFLEFIPEYSAHKQAIRRRIHRQVNHQYDAPLQGRGFPRDFLSFGIASIEVPIHALRQALAHRLASDLCKWWLNSEGDVVYETAQVEQDLRELQLLGKDLRQVLALSEAEQPYQQIIQQWLQQVADEAQEQNWLECVAQLPNIPPFVQETGKILHVVSHYLSPKIEQFRYENFLDAPVDSDLHGKWLVQMYANRDRLVQKTAAALQDWIHGALGDRQQGAKLIQSKLRLMERSLNAEIEQLDKEVDQVWLVLEKEGLLEYKQACSRMVQFRSRWAAAKQEWMNEQFQTAIAGQAKAFQALIERKSRTIAVDALRRVQRIISQLKWQLEHWINRIANLDTEFWERSQALIHQANQMEGSGLRLFQPEEFEALHLSFREMNRGVDALCQQLTIEVLQWCDRTRFTPQQPATPFRLLDVEEMSETGLLTFKRILTEVAYQWIKAAPPRSPLNLTRDACKGLIKLCPYERDQQQQIELLFKRSRPLLDLDPQAPLGRFHYQSIAQAAIVGGAALKEPSVQRQFALLQKYFRGDDAIAPLPDSERHRILAIQEVGGFSLRCIEGIETLRKYYQAWRGQRVLAERIALKGGKASFPIPIHTQHDLVFWDIIPSDPLIERLVVIARAMGILREEIHPQAQRPVIQYFRTGGIYQEIVVLAGTWEDVVLVLELPDCRDDRLEIQRQVNEQLKQAETEPQRQRLRQRLETYLAHQNPHSNPNIPYPSTTTDHRYQWQKAIVKKFMAVHQLQEESLREKH
ncbi:MAG: tubulin-like doman-containing protein [Oculatellaceae cyanobacterium Prado106]|jgi:hypothetical protein|nr:tubulin-like doman-containing protein [Oculatellaceae cyanobacterium Prado106]